MTVPSRMGVGWCRSRSRPIDDSFWGHRLTTSKVGTFAGRRWLLPCKNDLRRVILYYRTRIDSTSIRRGCRPSRDGTTTLIGRASWGVQSWRHHPSSWDRTSGIVSWYDPDLACSISDDMSEVPKYVVSDPTSLSPFCTIPISRV